MINFKTNYTDERLRVNLNITQEIEDFLNSKFEFIKHPKGFLVAKMRNPNVQITIHFPEKFEVGEETSLLFWQHTNPYNTVENRFSFTPVQDDKPATFLNTNDFLEKVNEYMNLCAEWRDEIYRTFGNQYSVECLVH